MVRVTLFFVGGIALAIGWPALLPTKVVMSIAAFLTLLYLIRWRAGALGLAIVLLLGYARVEFHTSKNDAHHFIHDSLSYYTATIARYSEEKENSWKVEADVEWKESSGRILLYFSKKDFRKPFDYGDVLLIRGSPTLVTPPSNPGEFDMQRHLFYKNIYHRHYLRGDQVKLIDSGRGNGFIAAAIKVRLWSDRQLKTYVAGEREQATASALVLGVTDGLDNELLQSYSSTGAMHVLAVSGLHVSIIYWIILLLGKPLEKLKSGKVILAIGSVVILWIYAFVTGWSPSVLRAVMMFTFVALARPWRQSTNIYNTMAASAFCLLVYDPFFLMSVGFQLSYIAVFGIVFLHPHLYLLWEPKARIWDEVWKVTSVSIAAQIATVPISLFYFHQFPNYFLIANLLVIPASFVVLVAGLAVLPLSLIPILAKAVAFLLQWVIYLMNGIVMIIGSLPFAVVGNIFIDGIQAWLLAGITLCVLFCILYRHLRWLRLALVLSVIFSAVDWFHLFKVVEGRHVTVYYVKGKTAMDFQTRGLVQTYGEAPAFNASAHRISLGASQILPMDVFEKNGCAFIYFHNLTLVVIKSRDFILPENLIPDFVIISNNSVRSLERIKSGKVIIDSSNSPYFAERLLKQSDADIHSVHHHGAFQYSF